MSKFKELIKRLDEVKVSSETERFLLKLARNALEYYFKKGKRLGAEQVKLPSDKRVRDELTQKRATFVTLEKLSDSVGNTKRYSLRGCIGHLIAINPLYKDVLENTYAAAFEDPRFPPLQPDELNKIRLEISILTPQVKLPYESIDQLISFLEKYKPGVVLDLGGRQATFLPQVWKEIESPEGFLSHLCMKAGFPPDCWVQFEPTIYVYFAQEIKEKVS